MKGMKDSLFQLSSTVPQEVTQLSAHAHRQSAGKGSAKHPGMGWLMAFAHGTGAVTLAASRSRA